MKPKGHKPADCHPWSYQTWQAIQNGKENYWAYLQFQVKQEHLSTVALLRLEWIIFYYTVGKRKVAPTARHFGIARKTLHHWLKRFDTRRVKSLEEQSLAPKKKRQWMVTDAQEQRIRVLRKKNMEFGKKKLTVLYQKEYGEKISTWKIERVIRKHRLYPNPIAHKKQVEKRRKAIPKIRIHQIKDTLARIKRFGFIWHIDAIIIWWYGQRRVIFTALEDKTKIAYARVYKTNTSGLSEDFLKRLMYLVEGKVEIMHSDNGGEFAGDFEKACKAFEFFRFIHDHRHQKITLL